jgi:hypothetical protein
MGCGGKNGKRAKMTGRQGLIGVLILVIWSHDARAQPENRFERLINVSRSAPPEIFVSVALAMSSVPELSQQQRVRLLVEAFQISEFVNWPVGRSHVRLEWRDEDAEVADASTLQLDRLSLQCKIVERLLELDPNAAVVHFNQIRLPELEPLACSNSLVSDLRIYYHTTTLVINSIVLSQGDKWQTTREMMQSLLAHVTSSVQLAPMARTVRSYLLRDGSVAGDFTLTLAARMEALKGSDREFGTAMLRDDLAGEMRSWSRSAFPTYALKALLKAYGTYLRAHLSGNRCSDTVSKQQLFERAGLMNWRSDYNRLLSETIGSDGGLMPLLLTDNIVVDKVLDAPYSSPRLFSTPEKRRLLESVRLLSMDRGDLSDSPQAVEYENIVSKVMSFPGNRAIIAFHEKSRLFADLLSNEVRGEARGKLIKEYVSFLESSPFVYTHTAQWIYEVHRAFAVSKGANAVKSPRSPSPERDGASESLSVVAAAASSHNPVLSVIAQLAELKPSIKFVR